MYKNRRVVDTLIFLGIISFICGISSCEIINPTEEIPSFISIPSVELITNEATEGTNKHNIKDIWIYVGDDLLGAYPLPAKIPVLADGEQSIEVFPGIKDNGISATPNPYSLLTTYQSSVTLVKGETVAVSPQTRYIDNSVFLLNAQEGFEGNGHRLGEDLDGDATTAVEISTEDSFEGNANGLIKLTESNPFFSAGSTRFTLVPSSATKPQFSYLELNYKTDVSMEFNLVGYDVNGSAVFVSGRRGLNPKAEWGKVYFNFSQDVIDLQFTSTPVVEWQFCIHADYNRDQAGADEAIIRLDNLKFVSSEF